MSYLIASISNGGGAPEQAYRKLQSAGACPEKPFAGTCRVVQVLFCYLFVFVGAVLAPVTGVSSPSFPLVSFVKPPQELWLFPSGERKKNMYQKQQSSIFLPIP